MEEQQITDGQGFRKCSFPLPDGRQLVLTIYGDIVYGDDAEGWSATDVRVFTPEGKHCKTLALVMYRHNEGQPSTAGAFSVMTFDAERAYLTRIRLRQATRDLSETDRRILDIAAENGFQDLKGFNTKFREIFGRSPSDYRKSLKEEHIRYDATFKKVFVNIDDAITMDKLRNYAEPHWSSPSIQPSPVQAEAIQDEYIKPEKLQSLAEQLRKIADALSGES